MILLITLYICCGLLSLLSKEVREMASDDYIVLLCGALIWPISITLVWIDWLVR